MVNSTTMGRSMALRLSAGLLVLAGASALGIGSVTPLRSAEAAVHGTNRNRYGVPFIAKNDVRYIDAIVPHHRAALAMAEMEVKKGARSEVKAMAQAMIEMQMEEIELLLAAREELTGRRAVPKPPRDPHMVEDMGEMDAATGAEMDSLFIRDMIPHHAEAISIAHRALRNLRRADVIQNAKNVIRDQAIEIGELQSLRTDDNF